MTAASTITSLSKAWRLRRAAAPMGYIGWAGHGNLGDDAMLTAAEGLTGKRLAPILSPGRERLLGRIGAGSERLDGVLLGGGTLINRGREAIVKFLIEQEAPLFAIGTGVGSPGFSLAEEPLDAFWTEVLPRFRFLGVRGPRSLAKLQAAGVWNATVVGDLALASTPAEPKRDRKARRYLLNYAPDTLARDRTQGAAAYAALSHLVADLARAGFEPLAVAFAREDEAPLARLLAMAECAATVHRPRDFAAYTAFARQSSFAIGVRLHSAVFAAMCGLPTVLIAYRDKCWDFAEGLGSGLFLQSYEQVGFGELRAAAESAIVSTDGDAMHARCLEFAGTLRESWQRIAESVARED